MINYRRNRITAVDVCTICGVIVDSPGRCNECADQVRFMERYWDMEKHRRKPAPSAWKLHDYVLAGFTIALFFYIMTELLILADWIAGGFN